MEEDDEILLLLFSHLFVNNHDDHICFHDLEFLCDFKSVWNCVRALLNDNMYALQDAKTRMSIWRTMLPALSDTDIRALATKYDFSGGQIENIARHYTIDGILNGESSVSLATLMAHCDNERLEQKEGRRIGFSV